MESTRRQGNERSGQSAEVFAALRSLEPFSPFSADELRELMTRCTIETYESGVTLIREGEPSDNRVYFILSGAVSVFVNERFILTLDRPGDIFGEMSLVGDEPRSATVRTDGPARCLVISSALRMGDGQDHNYKLRYYFTRMFSAIMAGKLRVTSERAKLYEEAILHTRRAEAYSTDLEERVAHNLRQIRLYSHLVESAKETILVTDLRGVVESANPALRETFGVPVDKIVGVPLGVLLGLSEGGAGSWEQIAAAARERGWKGEVMVHFTDSGECPADCTVSVVRQTDRAPLAYSVILHDSRERRAYQERILQQRKALERAFHDLQELDRLKDQFLSRVSHELRTPLTSLLGAMEMLVTPGMVEPGERDGYLEMTLREAQALAALVDKVLTISRIESGQMPFAFEPGRLDELLAVAVAKVRPQAEAKRLGLELRVETPIEPVSYDEQQMMTAVGQILENAVKFSDSGAIHVFLAQDARESVIRIQDPGRGIDRLNIGRIFNKLGQLEGNADPARGLGLGLPLSYLIVRAHSGRLLVNSEPGRGSVFTVALPRHPPAGEAPTHLGRESA